MIINDWQRGKLPFFVSPPMAEDEIVEENTIEEDKLEIENNQE